MTFIGFDEFQAASLSSRWCRDLESPATADTGV
jgi:hypothetical protein